MKLPHLLDVLACTLVAANSKRFMVFLRLLLDQVDLQRLEETGWTPKTE